MVGASGFEPEASCAQGRRATRLRYAPTWLSHYFNALYDIASSLTGSTVPRLCQNTFDLNDLAQQFVTENAHQHLKDRDAMEAMEFLETSAMLQKQARYLGLERPAS